MRRQVYQTRSVACAQYRTHLPDEGWEENLLEPERARIMQVVRGLPESAAKSLLISNNAYARIGYLALAIRPRASIIPGSKFAASRLFSYQARPQSLER